MAKREAVPSISDYVPATSVATPHYNPSDISGRGLLIESWEFKVSEKGTEYVTFNATFAADGTPLTCTSFDKAIIGQLMAYPPDAPRPVNAKVVAFGRYFALT